VRTVGRVDGKVAVVTGGASGIGAAVATLLAAEGAGVVVADVDDAGGAAVAAALGPRARFEHLDVRDEGDWSRVVQTAAALGPLGVLVNAAGMVEWGGVVDMVEASFRRLLDVNTVGPFLGMQAVVPAMRAGGGGSIVNIASTSAMVGSPASIGYTASKWALRGMTKAAALELAPHGIRVNSVHPGVIDTPMSRAAGAHASGKPPLGHVGDPLDVAYLVLYLASDEARYTTGAEHVVDGGRLAG
jgi:3alpha(or 20beta)-hydroxysteroid dehydrogenase